MKKNKRKITFLKTFLIFLLIGVCLFTGLRFWIKNLGNIQITNPDNNVADLTFLINNDSNYSNLYKDSNKINILVLGTNGGLTDTIMLVNYDTETKDVNIISIPRDTYCIDPNNPDANLKKINSIYKGEVENTARAVSGILCDIPINYYALVDFEGVKNIVNSMGGVPMDIPFHMYYTDPYDNPPLHIDLKKGHQILDGDEAIEFLRFRHGNKGYPSYPMQDLDRVKAQQQFVKSAIKQCISLDITKIVKTGYNNVESNLTLGDSLRLVTSAMGFDSEDIVSCNLPGVPQQKSPYYYYPDEEKIEELITDIYSTTEE